MGLGGFYSGWHPPGSLVSEILCCLYNTYGCLPQEIITLGQPVPELNPRCLLLQQYLHTSDYCPVKQNVYC